MHSVCLGVSSFAKRKHDSGNTCGLEMFVSWRADVVKAWSGVLDDTFCGHQTNI